MAKCVSYWDASNWNSFAEVTNPQDRPAVYRITVYDRDGSVPWQATRKLAAHGTERIFIDEQIPPEGKREGLVVVEPIEEGDEFPAVLTIRAEGQGFKEGNRFVPFIRVPPGQPQERPAKNGIFNVRDFGAVGDCLKDNTTAIQNAIDAAFAAGGGIVFFPPGTYLVASPLNLKSDVTLLGMRPASKIKCTLTNGTLLNGVGALVNVTISGLVLFSTNAANAALSCIRIQPGDGFTASDIAVENCEICGFKSHGLRTAANTTTSFVKRLRVMNCYIHDLGQTCDGENDFGLGVQPNGCDGVYIAGNFFENIGRSKQNWAVYGTDTRWVSIVGNNIKNCSGGIAFAGDIPLEGVVVTGNLIDVTTDPAHIGILMRSGLKCAITGNYLKQATIESWGATDSVITGNVIDLQQAASILSGIRVGFGDGLSASHVIVANNRVFNGSSSTIAIEVVAGTDITIANNQIADGSHGIFLRSASAAEISRITIEGNRIQNVHGGPYILVENATEVEVSGNRCDGGMHAIGIAVDGASTSKVWVHHNRIGPGGDTGMRVLNASQVLVEDNLLDPPVFLSFTLDFDKGNIPRRNKRIADSLVLPFADGDRTPSVIGAEFFKTTNSEATSITGFDDGYVGQVIHILAGDENTTIESNESVKLSNGSSFPMHDGDTLTLVLFEPGVWHEIGRKNPLIA